MHTRLIAAILAMALDGMVVRGTVRDPAGLPVAGAVVYVKGSQQQTTTDERGRYALELEAGARVTLAAFRGGFRPSSVEIIPGKGSEGVDIQLELAPIADEVTVGAQAARAPADGQELRPLDVVRTPGTQADVFRALQTLPGVVAIDEGAGIYVRGGDVGETGVLLDGVALAHPYRYESPTGGWFGSVEPFLLEGLSFASAAFPARFGGVLGAVLDLRGLGQPAARQLQVTAGLAGISGKLALPLGSHAGVRLSGNRSLTRLLFAVNGEPRRFDVDPNGWDLSLSAHFASAALGAFKLSGFAQGDEAGVELEHDAFSGFLHNRTRQRFFAARWAKGLGAGWQVAASLGRDRYLRSSDVGALRMDLEDSLWSGRIDADGPLRGARLKLGVDGSFARALVAGQKPVRGGDFAALAGAYLFSLDHDDWRAGSYLELEKTIGRLVPSLGVRLDRFGRSRETGVQPRLRTKLVLAPGHALTLAWGLYRQPPAPGFADPYFGAERLAALRSEHWVLGYEWGESSTRGQLRVEAYDKRYDHLPLSVDERVRSDGYGFAKGLDLFARRAFSKGELRASYSFVRARRRATPLEQVNRYPLPAGTWPPDFEIPHSAELVASWRPTATLSAGLAWRVASGRAHTPILGAAPDGLPLFGDLNSERLPHYERLDLSLSRAVAAFGKGLLLAFAGVTNLLARENAFDYAYAKDYASRRPVTSAAPRSFYVGVTLTR